MAGAARHGDIVPYLVKEHGLKQEKAEEICTAHKDVIERGLALGSYTYHIASEVGKAAIRALGLHEDNEYPKEWLDPNRVQPLEDEDDTEDGC